jgi:hypothetical protein
VKRAMVFTQSSVLIAQSLSLRLSLSLLIIGATIPPDWLL